MCGLKLYYSVTLLVHKSSPSGNVLTVLEHWQHSVYAALTVNHFLAN